MKGKMKIGIIGTGNIGSALVRHTVTGFAPVSFANCVSVSGPRELATTTSCLRR